MGRMPAEQRRDQRIRTKDIAAHIRDDRGTRICSIDNLSLGGAFVRISEGPPVGSLVGVNLVRPGMKRVIALSARVISVRSPSEAAQRGTIAGLGLSFENVSADAITRIGELLAELGAAADLSTATRSSASAIVSAPRSPPSDETAIGSMRQSFEAEHQKQIAEIARLTARNAVLEKQVVELTTELGGLRRKLRG